MKKRKNIIIKIIGDSTIIMTVVAMKILIAVLMIFDFFGSNLTKEKVENNLEYGDAYLEAVNENIKDGYVPLQRILYFRLEDETLTFNTLYDMNLDRQDKKTDEIESVCTDERLKNLVACTLDNIEQNKEYLVVTTRHFNFPLDTDSYQVTSFFNQQREVYGQTDTYQGWDLATSAKTPVYSVCDGTVSRVTFTQDSNVPFSESGNKTGNIITIKCDEDYDQTYYVMYAHLYPNSAKVKVGDKVNHWTKIAEVGTTGYSTGNHLHYQVNDENNKTIDGMQFIDFTLSSNNEPHFDKVVW